MQTLFLFKELVRRHFSRTEKPSNLKVSHTPQGLLELEAQSPETHPASRTLPLYLLAPRSASKCVTTFDDIFHTHRKTLETRLPKTRLFDNDNTLAPVSIMKALEMIESQPLR